MHPDLQPASYLMLAWLADEGPLRASAMAESFSHRQGCGEPAATHLVELGLVTRMPDPDDGRAMLVAASDDAVRRLADVSAHRRKWLDEQLGDWSAEELAGFVETLGRYNRALNA